MSVQLENPRVSAAKQRPKQPDAVIGPMSRASLPLCMLRLLLRGIFRLVFKVRVYGLEKVPRSPVIVCANHLGWTDPFLVLLFLPVEPRIYVLGEEQVLGISSFRTFVIDTLRVMVALDRSKPVQALRTMEGALQKGGSLLIFPEGRLGEQEGELGELQEGAAHASQRTGAPLLPVGLTGTSRLWLRRSLTVRIGDPIAPEDFSGELRARLHAMTAELDASMRALLPGDGDHSRVRLLERRLTKLF